MKKQREPQSPQPEANKERAPKLTVEALEARIAPALAVDKKTPVPPPYAPGTLYGLVSRENLQY